jgi:hypothetical protein
MFLGYGREEEEEEEESRTSRGERGHSLDERCWRKKSQRKRSRESRRHGLTSPRDGSADCDRGDADDGGREELRKRWHACEAKEMAQERRIIFHQSATTNTVDCRKRRKTTDIN